MRVLVAEDEQKLALFIARGLRRHGMAVDLAADGELALTKALLHPYDVVVLDRALPSVHGDEVCRRLSRSRAETRILMLTASAGLGDRIEGLNLGADDYLGKPFAFVELVARVRALARRARGPVATVVSRGDLTLDSIAGVARRGGRALPLTRKEFRVLEVLVRAEGRPVTAEELLARAWDEGVDPLTSSARNTVMRLRQKLGDPCPIESRPGLGYFIR
jgi:DNA-binding response OmpR family regulator